MPRISPPTPARKTPDPMPQDNSATDVPAIGYIRVSTAREEMISPELQEAAIRDWCRRHGRRLVRIITDLDATGRNFRRRVREAIDAIKAGEAREIVVWKFSRFGRQRLGWAIHLDELESVGGELQSATEEVDARTAAGRFQRGILAEVAAFESDRASEQWKEAHAYRLKAGLPATGGPRWGYIRRGRVPIPGERSSYRADPADPGGERYEPDPTLRDVYVSLYEQYAYQRKGGNLLAQWLNTQGLRTVRGEEWSARTVYRLLDSGFAAGLLRVHRPDCRCTQRGRCRNVTYLPGTQEPVISRELWEAYLERRRAQQQRGPRTRTATYSLSGLLRCSAGRVMSAAAGSGQPRGYAFRCDRHWQGSCTCGGAYIRRAYAEQRVLEWLDGVAADIDKAAAQLTPATVKERPVRTDADRLQAELARVERALARLQRMRALDDDDSPEAEREYLRARDELRAERDRLQQQLQAARDAEQHRPESYRTAIVGLLEEWEILTASEQRDLLSNVIRGIWVHPASRRGVPPQIEIVPVWAPAPGSAA